MLFFFATAYTYNFDFIVADVQCRILGADFLAKNYLAPNHRDAELINLQDYSTLPAEHARGFKSLPINFVNQIEDPYYSLLDKFPEICTKFVDMFVYLSCLFIELFVHVPCP